MKIKQLEKQLGKAKRDFQSGKFISLSLLGIRLILYLDARPPLPQMGHDGDDGDGYESEE